MKYEILVRILDKICSEASAKHKSRYAHDKMNAELLNQARSRAFIHLYLKVLFGILEFDERERTITDGAYDGGVDGYYIDRETKTIHLIQAKFRANEKNFEGKLISFEEILSMDINRVLEGETSDEQGNPYNGKIKQLQREVSEIPDVARYSYKIVILANLKDMSFAKLRQLTGGFAVEVFDFEKSYERLVFPVISGTYFTANDISIPIDLSNKNSGSKISYTVRTKISECEITVLFVPTIEIARIMNKYKNSILRYNPRSYLDLEGQSVNRAIRDTILSSETNEFALFNNGITMLSDETNINEKIGQKNKAQLRVKNPQIINGGQTSYTLGRLYSETPEDEVEALFADKEVLLKVITLLESSGHAEKVRLIDEISNATNKQTPVINADRFANEILHQQIQKKVFDRYGFLYERKRGEFSDGQMDGYVRSEHIIERNHFLRLFYTSNGRINRGFQKKLFQRNEFPDLDLDDNISFDRLYLAFHVFNRLKRDLKPNQRIEKDVYAKVFVYIELFLVDGLVVDSQAIDINLVALERKWQAFLREQQEKSTRGKRAYIDKATGEARVAFSEPKYYRSSSLERDITEFLSRSDRDEEEKQVPPFPGGLVDDDQPETGRS